MASSMDSKTLLIVVAVILLFMYMQPSKCSSSYTAPVPHKPMKRQRYRRKYEEPVAVNPEMPPVKSMYGLPTNNPAPVKSMYGLPTNNPAPLKSMYEGSFQAKNPAPVKSMYGLPTNNAAQVKSRYEGSFQAKNPAPVSFYTSGSAVKMAAYKKKY